MKLTRSVLLLSGFILCSAAETVSASDRQEHTAQPHVYSTLTVEGVENVDPTPAAASSNEDTILPTAYLSLSGQKLEESGDYYEEADSRIEEETWDEDGSVQPEHEDESDDDYDEEEGCGCDNSDSDDDGLDDDDCGQCGCKCTIIVQQERQTVTIAPSDKSSAVTTGQPELTTIEVTYATTVTTGSYSTESAADVSSTSSSVSVATFTESESMTRESEQTETITSSARETYTSSESETTLPATSESETFEPSTETSTATTISSSPEETETTTATEISGSPTPESTSSAPETGHTGSKLTADVTIPGSDHEPTNSIANMENELRASVTDATYPAAFTSTTTIVDSYEDDFVSIKPYLTDYVESSPPIKPYLTDYIESSSLTTPAPTAAISDSQIWGTNIPSTVGTVPTFFPDITSIQGPMTITLRRTITKTRTVRPKPTFDANMFLFNPNSSSTSPLFPRNTTVFRTELVMETVTATGAYPEETAKVTNIFNATPPKVSASPVNESIREKNIFLNESSTPTLAALQPSSHMVVNININRQRADENDDQPANTFARDESPRYVNGSMTPMNQSIISKQSTVGPIPAVQRGVAMDGIVYSPYNDDRTCKRRNIVWNDLNYIKSKNIQSIRIYATDCHAFRNILPAARTLGLKVSQGIWIWNNVNEADGAIDDLIYAGQTYGWDLFSMVFVGNEVVLMNKIQVPELIAKMNEIRGRLRAAGFTGAVTTAEPPSTYLQNPQLCGAMDVVGVNAHPYFNPGSSADTSGSFIQGQVAVSQQACPNKEVYIAEVGYPSAGLPNGANFPSPENQRIAIDQIMTVLNGQGTFLSTFDDYWKDPGPHQIEQHFGIIDLL